MSQQPIYLIASADFTRDNAWQVAADAGWDWHDEREATDKTPYQVDWFTQHPRADIRFIQDDLLGVAYFTVSGAGAAEASAHIRATATTLEKRELIDAAKGATAPDALDHLLRGLAVIAPKQPDQRILQIFRRAFASDDARVRKTAIWASTYIDWPQIEALVRSAAGDADPEVQRLAQFAIEGYEKGL